MLPNTVEVELVEATLSCFSRGRQLRVRRTGEAGGEPLRPGLLGGEADMAGEYRMAVIGVETGDLIGEVAPPDDKDDAAVDEPTRPREDDAIDDDEGIITPPMPSTGSTTRSNAAADDDDDEAMGWC